MDVLKIQDGESNQEHYARLLALREDLKPALRRAKQFASVDANVAEAERRYKRDVAKAKATAPE